jgi:hypothetical protein
VRHFCPSQLVVVLGIMFRVPHAKAQDVVMSCFNDLRPWSHPEAYLDLGESETSVRARSGPDRGS